MSEDSVSEIGKGLGRFYSEDKRDEQFLMRAVIPSEDPVKRFRYYPSRTVYDQGVTPQCVGYTWRAWMNTSLIMDKSGPSATEMYRQAQLHDEWSGTNYDGSSIRGGAKALDKVYGVIDTYVWAWNADDCRRWLLNDKGTICLGTPWFRDMAFPSRDGIVSPTGTHWGGHAYLALGYSDARGAFRCLNSWGRGWGQQGRFWLLGEDLDRLLGMYGEACAAVQIRT